MKISIDNVRSLSWPRFPVGAYDGEPHQGTRCLQSSLNCELSFASIFCLIKSLSWKQVEVASILKSCTWRSLLEATAEHG